MDIESKRFDSQVTGEKKFIQLRFVSATGFREVDGHVRFDSRPLSDVAIRLVPGICGAPPPDAATLYADLSGIVTARVSGREWYADVIAPGHVPTRMFVALSGGLQSDPSSIQVKYLLPSQPGTVVVSVAGGPPPVGTVISVSLGTPVPQVARDLCFSVAPDGMCELAMPIEVEAEYRAILPNGRFGVARGIGSNFKIDLSQEDAGD